MFTILLIVTVLIVIFYIKWRQSYWKRKGFPSLEPEFFFGNVKKVIKREQSISYNVLERYREMKKISARYVGCYYLLKPSLMLMDPMLIKQVLVKDFNDFTDRGLFHSEKDVLSLNLANIEGAKWRELRTKLTPTFTSGKMKIMFDIMVEKAYVLETVIEQYATAKEAMDVKDVLGRFTTDIVGCCGFGIECNSLAEPDNEFRKYGKKAFDHTLLKTLTRIIPRPIMVALNVKTRGADVTNFFVNVVRETVKNREQNGIVKNDFLASMMQLKNEGLNNKATNETRPFTENDMIAQCFAFFAGGFETSSTTMTFALLELGQNQEIQDKLRQEINDVLKEHGGQFSYEAIMSMSYLEKVVNETLRKFSPAPLVPRICQRNYTIPGSEHVIEKGTLVEVPILGLHRDPEYYPNPEVFDPERFSKEEIAKRPECTFLPFGEGPRMCIAFRFGLLQARLGLASLVKNFRFVLSSKTHLPIDIAVNSAIMAVKGDVWVNVEKIK